MEIFSITSHLAEENYITHLNNGVHTIIGDEPLDKGGQNQGFSPFEFVMAGLALCKSATMRMYAERKGWQTGKIDVQVEMQYGKDNPPKILTQVSFTGELDEIQKARLLEIADKCPTHKLLMGEKILTTILKPSTETL